MRPQQNKKRNPHALQMNANVNCHSRPFKFHFKNSVPKAKTCPDCLSAWQFVCLSECLPDCQSACWSTLLLGSLQSFCLSLGRVSPFSCPTVSLSAFQSVSPSVHLLPYLLSSLFQSGFPSLCLSSRVPVSRSFVGVTPSYFTVCL